MNTSPVFRIPNSLSAFIRLTRWEDYVTFMQFVIGFLLAKHFLLALPDWILLGKTLLVLAPLLYGGIYALNDIQDSEQDRQHPVKKDRPIPSGQITKKRALQIAIVLISLAFVLSILFDGRITLMAAAFLLINLFYIYLARSIPYLELVVNSIPHPLRFYFGLWLGGGTAFAGYFLLVVYFLGILGLCIFKRYLELEQGNINARQTLKHYSKKGLLTIWYVVIFSLAVATLFAHGLALALGGFWLAYNLVAMVGYFRSETLRSIIRFAWR